MNEKAGIDVKIPRFSYLNRYTILSGRGRLSTCTWARKFTWKQGSKPNIDGEMSRTLLKRQNFSAPSEVLVTFIIIQPNGNRQKNAKKEIQLIRKNYHRNGSWPCSRDFFWRILRLPSSHW